MRRLPPDPIRSRRPAWLPGACDAHPCSGRRRAPVCCGAAYTPPDSPEALAALHRRPGSRRPGAGGCHATDNRAMLDAIASSNGTWRGVAMVDADVTDRELRALHDGGVRGLRFNFVRHLGGAPDLQAVEALLDRAAPLGWHAVLHLDAEDLVAYRSFLHGLRVPFVIDHMGRVDAAQGLDQPPFRLLLELMEHELAWSRSPAPSGLQPWTTVSRRHPVRARSSTPRPTASCGDRLSASQRPRDAQRRRAGRPVRAVHARRGATPQDPGRQPDSALLGDLAHRAGCNRAPCWEVGAPLSRDI